MTTQQYHSIPASRRWVEIREAAGFSSDRALERAADMSSGTIWTWITSGRSQRDPNIRSLRILKGLLKVSLDELDALLTALREKSAATEQQAIK